MTHITSPHAVAAAGGQRNIEPWEKFDTVKFTAWRDELQSRTRTTHLKDYAQQLEPADAFALLLHVRG